MGEINLIDFYVYDSPCQWGVMFAMAAQRAGYEIQMFKQAEEVPEGTKAFIRVSQHPRERKHSKYLVQALHDKGCVTLPSLRESLWYDDKVRQYEDLREYLPKTHIIRNAKDAQTILGKMKYPFISKSLDGASSNNVRFIQDIKQARVEVIKVFGGGLETHYEGQLQRDYLYWQEYVPNNSRDYRVYILGDYVCGITREVKPGTVFASGSGISEPIIEFAEGSKESQAVKFAVEISKKIDTRWMAYDIIFNDCNEPMLLEVSSSWKAQMTKGIVPLFSMKTTGHKYPTKQNSGYLFDIAVEVLNKEDL